MYVLKFLFLSGIFAGLLSSSQVTGLFDFNELTKPFESILNQTQFSAEKENIAAADIYIKVEIGRNGGTNRKGVPCQCPGVCFGVCSVGVGFSRSASEGEVNAYLDFNDHLNVARIYFSDEIDSDEPSFYVDEETLVNLRGVSDSKLNGVILEKGVYPVIPHEGNIRINNMESRYTGYVDVNVRRY